jgi:hypothetical protein
MKAVVAFLAVLAVTAVSINPSLSSTTGPVSRMIHVIDILLTEAQ